MRKKVLVRFNSLEAQQLLNFCNFVGMDAEQVCKKAVIYAMNDTIRRAEKLEQLQKEGQDLDGTHNAEGGNTSADLPESRLSESGDSSSLADQETPANP